MNKKEATTNLSKFEANIDSLYKLKKNKVIQLAKLVGEFMIGDKRVGDGLFTFGDYDEDHHFVGDERACFKLRKFVVTGCQRSISERGQVSLTLRDDREGKIDSKDLFTNSDKDVLSFLSFMEPILNKNLSLDEFQNLCKAQYGLKKDIIVAIAKIIGDWEIDGVKIADGVFTFGDYDEDYHFIGDDSDLFKHKDFTMTGCQRVITDKGSISLLLRDDKAGKSKDVNFCSDKEFLKLMKWFVDALGVEL